MRKLNLRVVNCIFVGYSSTQKGYVCWSPAEKRLFVSMDVTFRELESYYSSEVISPFRDSLDTGGMRRDGDSSSDDKRMMVICTSDMFPPSTPLIPLSIRWTSHENVGIPPNRYEFPYDIVKFLLLTHITCILSTRYNIRHCLYS
jgi:hypothetical protein